MPCLPPPLPSTISSCSCSCSCSCSGAPALLVDVVVSQDGLVRPPVPWTGQGLSIHLTVSASTATETGFAVTVTDAVTDSTTVAAMARDLLVGSLFLLLPFLVLLLLALLLALGNRLGCLAAEVVDHIVRNERPPDRSFFFVILVVAVDAAIASQDAGARLPCRRAERQVGFYWPSKCRCLWW